MAQDKRNYSTSLASLDDYQLMYVACKTFYCSTKMKEDSEFDTRVPNVA